MAAATRVFSVEMDRGGAAALKEQTDRGDAAPTHAFRRDGSRRRRGYNLVQARFLSRRRGSNARFPSRRTRAAAPKRGRSAASRDGRGTSVGSTDAASPSERKTKSKASLPRRRDPHRRRGLKITSLARRTAVLTLTSGRAITPRPRPYVGAQVSRPRRTSRLTRSACWTRAASTSHAATSSRRESLRSAGSGTSRYGDDISGFRGTRGICTGGRAGMLLVGPDFVP